jgi:hypothetical protein
LLAKLRSDPKFDEIVTASSNCQKAIQR